MCVLYYIVTMFYNRRHWTLEVFNGMMTTNEVSPAKPSIVQSEGVISKIINKRATNRKKLKCSYILIIS